MYPESEVCSKCHEHTSFVRDVDEGDWVSVCCWSKAMPVDVEEPEIIHFKGGE